MPHFHLCKIYHQIYCSNPYFNWFRVQTQTSKKMIVQLVTGHWSIGQANHKLYLYNLQGISKLFLKLTPKLEITPKVGCSNIKYTVRYVLWNYYQNLKWYFEWDFSESGSHPLWALLDIRQWLKVKVSATSVNCVKFVLGLYFLWHKAR